MKLQRHNLAMQWILRRRTNEVKGKANPLYNEFKKYQSALSDGFEGTMNEYMVSTFEQGGRVGYQSGQLVQPGFGRQGYAGETRGPFKAEVIQIYNDIKKSGKKVFTRDIAERVTTSKMTGDALKSQIAEYLKRENLPYEKSDLFKTPEARKKAAESTKAGSRIERVLSDADKEKLFADIRKYRKGVRIGPDATMNIKDFAKYFDEGTSDVVISRQINRVANDILKLPDHPVKGKEGELAAKRTKYQIMKAGDREGKFQKIPKEPGKHRHHMRAKGIKLGEKLIPISPSLADIAQLDAEINSVKLQEQSFEKIRNKYARELLELREYKPEGWQRKIKEINALAKRESRKIPKHLRPYLFFETMDEAGNLKPIGGWRTKAIDPTSTTPFDAATRAVPPIKNMVDSKGVLGEGFSKVAKKMPKTAGALAKTGRFLFGAVEAGLIPLAVAAEGLYANYADKRDLKKALDQMVKNKLITQEQSDVLLKGFRQESRYIGGVGLETYAIEQPNVQEKLEEIGYGDRTQLLKAARAPIADIREQDARAKEIEKQRIEDAYKKEIGRRTIEFKSGGRVSFSAGSMGRRTFLKILAALGIGTAGAKSGAFLFSKAAGKKAAVKTGVDIATNTQGMPSWFPALVNKIIKEGDDVTSKLATKDRQIVHSKKVEGHDVDVYRDLDTGDIRVSVEGKTGKNLTAYDEGLELEYKAGEVIEKGTMKGKKTKPEFSNSETEAEFVRVGHKGDDAELDFAFRDQSLYPKSSTFGKSGNKSISDTSFLKNYATNKKPTLKEIAQTSNNKKQIKYLKENPHEDPRIPEAPDADIYDDYLPGIDELD